MSKNVHYAPHKFESYGDEEINAVTDCLKDGWLAGFGPRTIEFERRVSIIFSKEHGLFVNSGSSANLLAVACLDIEKGSEIITPACTFSTTLAPILQLGHKPVFCDVILNAYVPTVEAIIERITDKTKAIMIPNLIGNKPDWAGLRAKLIEIEREDIYLIEDSCDTMSSTQETDIASTSFYASHIITAGGSGGMVMFNDEALLKKATMYRDWGRIGNNAEDMNERFNHKVDGISYDFKFLYGAIGYNFKSSEMNAAFGLAQLDKFEKFKEIRRNNIERYLERLEGSNIMLPDDSIKPLWMALPFQYHDRLSLLTFLEDNNVQTRVTFAGNITRHPVYREFLDESMINSDTIMKNGFLLGAHHGMNIEDVDYVCDLLLQYDREHPIET
jgi:CDP-4-dehydro-6-deoxyglucose reductase, E1